MQCSTPEAIISELTRRLAESENQMRSIVQRNVSLESYCLANQQRLANSAVASEAYNTLLANYTEREEELRVANEANARLDKELKTQERLVQVANETNEQLDTKLQEEEKLVKELQNDSRLQKLKLRQTEEKLAKLAKAEEVNSSHRAATLEAENAIKKKDGVIEYLINEKERLIAKSRASEIKAKKAEDELAACQEMLEKSKCRVNSMLESEKTIGDLKGKITELQSDVERLKEELTEATHDMESKDTLLNMQRQEMEKQDATIKLYETKFQAKARDFPQIAARADEGDRLWSKIEEREKKFAEKEIMLGEKLGAVGAENARLQAEKKKLQTEVDELKQCFELCELKLSGTNDKVHMPWLLAQLRESITLKEKVVELEEIIRGEGYTIKAKEAERAYNEKEREMSVQMEKAIKRLSQMIETLKGQTTEVQDLEVPALLGKLEECLYEFGEDSRPIDDIMSTASSDGNQSMSLNTNVSFVEEEKVSDSVCINTRDFKDLMHPDHYAIMTSLAAGFKVLKKEGLCSAVDPDDEDVDDEELEAEELVYGDMVGGVNNHTSADEHVNPAAAAAEEKVAFSDDASSDIHIEKVLKILEQNEEELSIRTERG